ncbi:hypothetical protein EV715DRAFT_289116 [Schizophyllum commune]
MNPGNLETTTQAVYPHPMYYGHQQVKHHINDAFRAPVNFRISTTIEGEPARNMSKLLPPPAVDGHVLDSATSSAAAYRALAADAAADNVPYVPFAGTHLTELINIADACSDSADCEVDTAPALPKSPSPGSPKPAIPTSIVAAPIPLHPRPHPLRRARPSTRPQTRRGACASCSAHWHDVMYMLHRRSGYEVAEDEAVRTLLLQRPREASEMGADAPYFWERIQEL